jgi:hypothetical protein
MIFFRLVLIAFTSFFFFYYLSIENLIRTGKTEQYIIASKSCGTGNTGSSITIIHLGGEYNLSYPKTKRECRDLMVGSKIELFYNETFDYFYIPETINLYINYIFMCFIPFLLSFFPWIKYRDTFYKYMDRKILEKQRERKRREKTAFITSKKRM